MAYIFLKRCTTVLHAKVPEFQANGFYVAKINSVHRSLKKENSIICNNMDEPEGHYAKWNKPDRYRQELYDITYALRKKKKKTEQNGLPWWLS